MATPRTYVEAPAVTPAQFGLLSVALVLDDITPENHLGMGLQYEPADCGPVYDSLGACQPDPDFGTVSVSVDDTGEATLNVTGAPVSTYTIDWGDDEEPEQGVADPDGATHTYAAPGDYVVLVTDNRYGYVATVTVTVEDAEAAGPFDADAGFSKIAATGVPLIEADPFNVYRLFTCMAPGSIDTMAERARTALRLGEQRAGESVVASMLPRTDGAVDLTPTPGTPVHMVDGVALLEAYAAANYGGVPVIHTGRDVGSVLFTHGSIIRGSGRLETGQGAYVAAGAGYGALAGPEADPEAPLDPPAPGEAWLYVTGQVVIHRGTTIEVGPVMARAPQATNDATMLVERPWVVTWECFTAAVLVDTGFGVPT